MPMALGTVTLKIKLRPSEEREAIAKFIEYAFSHGWETRDVIEAVRTGEYITTLIKDIDESREG